MNNAYRLHRCLILAILAAIVTMGLLPTAAFAADGELTIHVMNVASQDTIVLECDGRFAMVDSGEDNDYPDGSNPKYPLRSGTTINNGHEDEVIAYLHELGVTEENFEFYIGTHAHSDHIGSADELIRAFRPERVYSPDYADEYIYYSANLWDNLYVYDVMKEAATEVDAAFITQLDYDAPVIPSQIGTAASPTFNLGSATITIMNWDNHPLGSGAYQDANDYCWGVWVSACGHSAFLAGDINNYGGDEDRLAAQLGHVDVLKMGHHGLSGSNTESYLYALSPLVAIQTGYYSNVPTSTIDALIDLGCHHYVCPEVANQGKEATVVHLSEAGVTVDAFADTSAVSFRQNCGSYEVVAYMDAAPVNYSGEWISPTGEIFSFDNSPYGSYIGLVSNNGGRWMRDHYGWYWRSKDGKYAINEWREIDGNRYFFDASGYMQVGWCRIDNVWHYFDSSGSVHSGWLNDGGKWYYLDPSRRGAMVTGFFTVNGVRYYAKADGVCPAASWVNVGKEWYLTSASCSIRTGWANAGGTWYLLDPSTGAMKTGWVDDGGSRYYLDTSGAMATGWKKLGGSWYYLSSSGALQTGWVAVGGSWYWLDLNTGAMLANGWTPDGSYVDSNGAWVKGKTR